MTSTSTHETTLYVFICPTETKIEIRTLDRLYESTGRPTDLVNFLAALQKRMTISGRELHELKAGLGGDTDAIKTWFEIRTQPLLETYLPNHTLKVVSFGNMETMTQVIAAIFAGTEPETAIATQQSSHSSVV